MGKTLIWDEPVPDRGYTIGADVAEGKVRDGGAHQKLDELRGERDFSAAYVLDDLTGDIVCAYHCNLNPYDLAADLLALALWYNKALIAIEVQGPGRGTQDALTRWGYRNFFIPLRRELVTPDFGDEPQFGFKTTTTTRPLMVARVHEYLKESAARIRDVRLLQELETIEYDKQGKARGIGRNKDDRFMAFAIANYARCEKLHMAREYQQQDQLAHLPPADRYVWEQWARLTDPKNQQKRDRSDPEEYLFRA